MIHSAKQPLSSDTIVPENNGLVVLEDNGGLFLKTTSNTRNAEGVILLSSSCQHTVILQSTIYSILHSILHSAVHSPHTTSNPRFEARGWLELLKGSFIRWCA